MAEHQNATGVKMRKPQTHKNTLLQTAQSFLRVASWRRWRSSGYLFNVHVRGSVGMCQTYRFTQTYCNKVGHFNPLSSWVLNSPPDLHILFNCRLVYKCVRWMFLPVKHVILSCVCPTLNLFSMNAAIAVNVECLVLTLIYSENAVNTKLKKVPFDLLISTVWNVWKFKTKSSIWYPPSRCNTL